MTLRTVRLIPLLGLLLPLVAAASSMVPRPPNIAATSYVLMDADNGQIIVEHNADKKLPPASLTKMMTAYIAETEIDNGTISTNDEVPISVNAWKTGGSRMFVREGTKVPLKKLLKGIVIDSGNDATVAVAEYIAGSEDAFADLMNQYAQKMGMKNTHFVNPTGLPADNHFSTAHDLSLLARHLIRDFPDHYSIYDQKSFTYNNIKQDNRNLLLWRDPNVDGVKTGHTKEAGYCLVASAKKDGTRLISVVMGTDSEQARATESQKLLTYGFRFYRSYKAYGKGDTLTTADIWLGDKNKVTLGLDQDLILTIPQGSQKDLKAQMKVDNEIKAPVKKGQQVGTVTVSLNGKTLAQQPLVTLEPVKEGGFFSRLWDHIVLFFKGLFS